MKTKNKIIRFLSFFISISILIVLLSFVNFSQLIKTVMTISIIFYIFAFALYLLSYFCRVLRLVILFEPKKISRYFLIVCSHQLLNRTLPFRSGEIFLPFFLKRITNITYSESIPTFLLLRLFDIISLLITFFFVVTFLGFSSNITALILIFFLFFISMLFITNLKKIFPMIIKIISIIFPKKHHNKLERFMESSRKALAISKEKNLKLFFLSILDRIFGYGVSVLLIIGMSFKISTLQIITANAVSSITEVLPINSFGSFGTLELGWAGTLIYFGVSKEIAISSGFSFHLLAFSFTISLGLVSIFLMKLKFNINPFVREKSLNNEQCDLK